MKAENKTTGHNRLIKITGLHGKASIEKEMIIEIGYVDKHGSNVFKAIALDNVIIPAILKGLNR